jgi:Acetyltransferase (GNAT) domain
MWTPDGELAGHIEFFIPVAYCDAFELSYQLYGGRFAGRGYTTEAVQLLVDYLFAVKKQNRIHLVIVPENAASVRVAEKCGFVLEGTVRGAFFNQGRSNDVLVYSLLRTDPRPWDAFEELTQRKATRIASEWCRQTSSAVAKPATWRASRWNATGAAIPGGLSANRRSPSSTSSRSVGSSRSAPR